MADSLKKSVTSKSSSNPEDNNDSPYKNALSKIKRISLGDDDFSSPQPIKTVPKMFKLQQPSKKGSSKKSILNVRASKRNIPNQILKRTKDNFNNLDVNSEHLQMAIALSKSTFAQENPERDKETTEPDLPTFLSPQQMPKVTTFLEKYGFKYERTQLHPESMKKHLEAAKKRKNSKFRFVTPILYTRTKEERDDLVNSKVSLLLSEQIEDIEKVNTRQEKIIHSPELRTYFMGNTCWNLNSITDFNKCMCSSLQFSPVKSNMGCLLKKWEEIPGWEESPKIDLTENLIETKQTHKDIELICDNTNSNEEFPGLNKSDPKFSTSNNVISSENVNDNSKMSDKVKDGNTPEDNHIARNCSSPDLFDSDNDTSCIKSPSRSFISDTEAVCLKSPNTNQKCVDNLATNMFSQISNYDESLDKVQAPVGIEHDQKGIEYFESFYSDGENSDKKNSIIEYIDLVETSDEDDPPINLKDLSKSKEHEGCGEKDDLQINSLQIDQHIVSFDHSLNHEATLIAVQPMDPDNISLEYNHSKSLNITDYVINMLNSQDDRDQEYDNVDKLNSSASSQESILIVSDEELNYSSRVSAHCNKNMYDLDLIDDSVGVDLEGADIDTIYSNLKNKYSQEKNNFDKNANEKVNELSPEVIDNPGVCTTKVIEKCDNATQSCAINTPSNSPIRSNDNSSLAQTPSNNLIIKTTDITPMADYDAMDTPKVRQELDKFGIKPLKRRRGVELLKYIYDTTHPILNTEEFVNAAVKERDEMPVKRRKLDTAFENNATETIQIVGTDIIQNEADEDLLFERKFSKKMASCRIPLQIVWYNFLCCNWALKENILMYEPIQLDVVHSMLKEQSGCNFHVEELITFLDKKCITFRTSQQQARKKPVKAKS